MILLLLQLYVSFLLIGVSAYGGGITAISLIQYEIVTQRGWLSAVQMRDVITLAQMTPGPIAINAATFTGYRVAGVPGSLVASLAVITPGLLLLAGYAFFVSRLRSTDLLNRVKTAMQPGILALILFAIYTFGSISIDGLLSGAFAVATFLLILTLGRRVHPIVWILAFGALGTVFFRS
jgi:chromate transporter